MRKHIDVVGAFTSSITTLPSHLSHNHRLEIILWQAVKITEKFVLD